MMLSAIPPQTPLSNPTHLHYPPNPNPNLLTLPNKPPTNSSPFCRATTSSAQTALCAANSSSAVLRHVSSTSSHGSDTHSTSTAVGNDQKTSSDSDAGEDMVASASAVATIIKKVSTSPVDFAQRIEKAVGKSRGVGTGGDGGVGPLVLPSADFQRLCAEQLDLFRRIVHPDARLSVYVRPAGSYVMDQLEMRRIAIYPGVNMSDIVILVGNFSVPAGLRAAEAALSTRSAEVIPELRALVFPMVKHPFVVGFLVAEIPQLVLGEEPWPSPEQSYPSTPSTSSELLQLQKIKASDSTVTFNFTSEQRLNAINISRSLAMAYVMDQKAMLLQQSSWQNNVRMYNLVEQIRGSLSSIRTLTKMLSVQLRRSEIAYDIAEDILVQGDHIKDTLQQLQDAVYLTKENIIHYNGGGKLRKIHEQSHVISDSERSQISNNSSVETSSSAKEPHKEFSLALTSKDTEMPMPPLALAPLQQEGIRPCNVTEVLDDLVGALEPLARKQQLIVKLYGEPLSRSLQVAVEEPALRQALSNLIEGALLRTQEGGKIDIVSTGAPAVGALVIIDDDGPDMQYMTHSLAPFGMDLFAEDKVEDNVAWNFIAGLTVAREILERYGCVVRVISPRNSNSLIGAGGTRIELWLPFSSPPGTDE